MNNKGIPIPEIIKDNIMSKYPAKVAKKRSKSMVINDPVASIEIQANVRTIPGIITQRGCSYAGCKGVVLGPTRDIVNLTHGPIGCGFYSWLTRRNQTQPGPDGENYMPYCFSTDMQDENIVFGGEKKLKEAIQEAYDIFHPKAISIFSTCPVGLIGDDIHSVAVEMKEKFGDCNVFGFSCEGYKGVSQSAGHHIANNQLFKHLVGNDDTNTGGKFRINLLGEYNIGGDAFLLEKMFEDLGITLVATFSGNSSVTQFERSHTADLNCIMCHRSINYVAEMMEEKYGIPWLKVNFIGAESTAKSLRKIASFFRDDELSANVEKMITEKMAIVKEQLKEIYPRTENKTAMLFVGGSRAHHYQDLFKELGMKILAAGYEFAHRDDYEGREVLPTIKVDADSRNIEEIKVEKDPAKYKERLSPEEKASLESQGLQFNNYDGMMKEMDPKSFVIDDISHWESEELIKTLKPDIFCAGIKEKYVIQKSGVPLFQMHSYDYGGPFAGFEGAVNFYKEIDRRVNTKVWGLMQAPWKKEASISASLIKAS
ncbi:MAG: nitrogenase molybdenum-iron protein alpha chain [Spirochaetales bacterium]|nr:nitrogenase molybdenum-iron protein alpha chain [Spirochaetales bacterium]